MLESLDWNEECGVFGLVGHPRAAELTFLGLYALQHRGQEGAGIVSCDGGQYHEHKDLGLVNDVFDRSTLDRLRGDAAIGHTRYSTTGSTVLPNIQPILANLRSLEDAFQRPGGGLLKTAMEANKNKARTGTPTNGNSQGHGE